MNTFLISDGSSLASAPGSRPPRPGSGPEARGGCPSMRIDIDHEHNPHIRAMQVYGTIFTIKGRSTTFSVRTRRRRGPDPDPKRARAVCGYARKSVHEHDNFVLYSI